jgi:hypothetical protein
MCRPQPLRPISGCCSTAVSMVSSIIRHTDFPLLRWKDNLIVVQYTRYSSLARAKKLWYEVWRSIQFYSSGNSTVPFTNRGIVQCRSHTMSVRQSAGQSSNRWNATQNEIDSLIPRASYIHSIQHSCCWYCYGHGKMAPRLRVMRRMRCSFVVW